MHTLKHIYCFFIGVSCLSESVTQGKFPPNSHMTLHIHSINQTGLNLKNTLGDFQGQGKCQKVKTTQFKIYTHPRIITFIQY